MEDTKIIDLYWQRREQALSESSKKYGKLCYSVAYQILYSHEDSEECVSDTWLRAWNAIPPQKPNRLSAFFARITRNLAIDRYRMHSAEKRGGAELALQELDECIPSRLRTESGLEEKELIAVLDRFLGELSRSDRTLFLRRYWFADSMADAASFCGMKENTAKSRLLRMRRTLKARLESEGIAV